MTMLLASRFTYIHEPKTGGTFVTQMLARLHGGLTDVPASRLRASALRLGLPCTSRLNRDLVELLLGVGYEAHDLEFVASHEHVVPTGGARTRLAERATSHDWRRYYSADLGELVRRRERLIFSLFPDLEAG